MSRPQRRAGAGRGPLAGWAARRAGGRYLRDSAARRRAPGVGAPVGGITRRWSGQIAVARLVAGLAPTAYLLVLQTAGRPGSTWLWLGLLGLLVVRRPDGTSPLAVWAVLFGVWWLDGPSGPPGVWWAVGAGSIALAGHAATAFVAGAPPDAAVDGTLLRRWSVRLAAVVAVTAALAALARVVAETQVGGSEWITAAVLVGLAAWLLTMRAVDPREK